jgi:hypothetical protein
LLDASQRRRSRQDRTVVVKSGLLRHWLKQGLLEMGVPDGGDGRLSRLRKGPHKIPAGDDADKFAVAHHRKPLNAMRCQSFRPMTGEKLTELIVGIIGSPPEVKARLKAALNPSLRPSHVWSIRTKLQIEGKKRDLALFNLTIDSKLLDCDVVAVRVDDVAPSGYAMDRATIRQEKTGRPVRFEPTDQTRQAIDEYLRLTGRKAGQFLFSGRGNSHHGLTTRQYARLVGADQVADPKGTAGHQPPNQQACHRSKWIHPYRVSDFDKKFGTKLKICA